LKAHALIHSAHPDTYNYQNYSKTRIMPKDAATVTIDVVDLPYFKP